MDSTQDQIDEGSPHPNVPIERLLKKWVPGLEVAEMGQKEAQST